jgi:hypothetical protein
MLIAERIYLCSDGTQIRFRALTLAEIQGMENVESRSVEIEGGRLPPEALQMMYTITRAVLSPQKIFTVLFDKIDAGRIDEAEMTALHNAILDFTAEQLLAREPTKGQA